MKHTNQMPTFWLLLITTIILTVAALINDKFLSSKYHVDLKKEPLLTSIMQGFGDRVYPDILFKNKKVASNIEVPIIEITEVAFEENTSGKVAQTLARVTCVKLSVLAMIESLTKEQQANGESNHSMMKENLEALTLSIQ